MLHAAEAESYMSRQRQSMRHAEPKQLHICVLFSSLQCNVAFGNSGRMAENNYVGKDLVSVCPYIVGDMKKEVQTDATQWFIELMIRSACFGHYYAYHQELETIQMFTACGT